MPQASEHGTFAGLKPLSLVEILSVLYERMYVCSAAARASVLRKRTRWKSPSLRCPKKFGPVYVCGNSVGYLAWMVGFQQTKSPPYRSRRLIFVQGVNAG